MKMLLLMRHAKSSWDSPSLPDHDRPLSGRGRRDASAIGEALAEANIVPDQILCSTATRTRQTAQGLFEAWGEYETIHYSRDLYQAGSEDFLEALQALPETVEIAMIISHNPGSEDFLEQLTGDREQMTTANVAQIEVQIAAWSELGEETEGKLLRLWRPKDL